MSTPQHGSDTVAHHAANAAAAAIPIGAYLLDAEPYVVFFATLLGLAWYGVLFYDRFFKPKTIIIKADQAIVQSKE